MDLTIFKTIFVRTFNLKKSLERKPAVYAARVLLRKIFYSNSYKFIKKNYANITKYVRIPLDIRNYRGTILNRTEQNR